MQRVIGYVGSRGGQLVVVVVVLLLLGGCVGAQRYYQHAHGARAAEMKRNRKIEN